MKNIKLYQLKNIKQCPFKGYISQFDFQTLNKKSSAIRKVYKDILKDYDFLKLSKEELKQIILNKLDDTYFLTAQEKDIEVVTIFNYLLRYIDYENQQNRKILAKNIYGTIQLQNKDIDVSADIVFDNGKNIELVKYKTGATTLSCKARTAKNLPENDIELYLLKKLGEQIYGINKPIIASFYHLKSKNEDSTVLKQFLIDKNELIDNVNGLEHYLLQAIDKKEQKEIKKQIKCIKDVLYFNNTEGNNIITYDYNTDLSDNILELCNIKLDFNSDKCKSSDCEFCDYYTLCNYNTEKDIDKNIVKQTKKSATEVELTKEQQEVVNIEEGIYRINAVAGSGKSSTMVLRVIELLKKGYKLNDILMITFTNKGCEELKEKILYWLNYYKFSKVNIKDLNIFTFNSFGETILSKEWNKLGFTQLPQLASTVDVNDIIKELLKEYNNIQWLNYKNPLLNYPNAKGAFKQLLIYFNLIKSFNYNSKTFISDIMIKDKTFKDIIEIEDLQEISNLIFEIYSKFNQKLKEKNLMQYQDQILYLIELFNKFPELVQKYGYSHIIVDEYQDTDFIQVQLLHQLITYNKFKSLVIVGDDSQAIYSFRNTTPENILNFHTEFDNVNDIYLLDNFRSTPEICSLANNIIKLNTQRIDKDIISKKSKGMLPKLVKCKTLEDERIYILDLIQNKINIGISKYEICYIGRTKKELLELQKKLNDKNIPTIIEASELYIDNSNVQSIINLANFFKNKEQDYYLLEYINASSEDILNMESSQINDIIIGLKDKIVLDLAELEKENDKEKLKIDYFYNMINPILIKDEIANQFINDIKEKTFYTFTEFLNYLYKIALYRDDTSIEKEDVKYDAVVLTTAHSSKGKEWSVVINSIDNYKYNKENISKLEEERRLLYVSLTRAKDELIITYNINENKTRNKGKHCLFADELNNKSVEFITI